MIRGAFAVAITLGGLAAAVGCSGRSIVIGGDPSGAAGESVSGSSVGATGGDGIGGNGGTGAFSATGGTVGVAATGATISSGGSSIGGTGTGGAYGGTSTGVNGGTSTLSGRGGTSGASIAEGGEGGIVDPYPRVLWEDGQGYRSACPEWGDIWGFTCWFSSHNVGSSCRLDGNPYCNTCSCAVPCETLEDCPSALNGQRAACLSSATNVPTCFVLCEVPTRCPTGMTCTTHPGSHESVCAWVSDQVE